MVRGKLDSGDHHCFMLGFVLEINRRAVDQLAAPTPREVQVGIEEIDIPLVFHFIRLEQRTIGGRLNGRVAERAFQSRRTHSGPAFCGPSDLVVDHVGGIRCQR